MENKLEEQVLSWLDEVEEELRRRGEAGRDMLDDGSAYDSASENELDNIELSDHNSASDISGDKLEDNELDRAGAQYLGKDGQTTWNIHFRQSVAKTRHRNLVRRLPGVKGDAKQVTSPIEAWRLFFSVETIQEIVDCTNKEMSKLRENYERERDARSTDSEEITALFGLFYLSGVMKSSHANAEDLWADDGTAPELFRLVMSLSRFRLLIRALRFDDITTRKQRKEVDKMAPIRKVFDDFVRKCKAYYSPHEYVTVDEMLESFRGRCQFRQFIPSKPAKYGIKIFSLADARIYYTYNMEVYVGRQPDGPCSVVNSPAEVVKRLAEPIENSGRNITVDNYFTSIPLALHLLKNKGLTLVGTLRKNKAEIPPVFLDTKRPVHSTMFAHDKDMQLVSYIPKKGKVVLMLSTMHQGENIDETTGDLCKPEVITFYNMTKGGVDVVDGLKSLYTVARKTNRWPLRIFYTLLDIAGLNSYIILRFNTDNKVPRRKYLKTLACDLCKPHLAKRASTDGLHTALRLQIQRVLGERQEKRTGERQKCDFCPKKKNRFTVTYCGDCSAAICKEHTSAVLCFNCRGRVLDEEREQE